MNLAKKKNLAAKVFGVGKGRVVFIKSRLNEIKEAITKQDMRELKMDGAIKIREIKGRKTKPNEKQKKGPGKIKKNVNKRKREYMAATRKLRKYLYHIKSQGGISKEEYEDARKKIRNRFFKSKSHLKEHIGGNKI